MIVRFDRVADAIENGAACFQLLSSSNPVFGRMADVKVRLADNGNDRRISDFQLLSGASVGTQRSRVRFIGPSNPKTTRELSLCVCKIRNRFW